MAIVTSPVVVQAAAAALGRLKRTFQYAPDGISGPVDGVIVATYATHSSADQAALIGAGVSQHAILRRRAELIRRGIIKTSDRARGAIVGRAEREAVIALFRDGWSVQSIAAMREVSPFRIEGLVASYQRHHGSIDRSTWYSCNHIAKMLGIPRSSILRLIADGWIADGQIAKNLHHRYTMADIMDIVRIRQLWMLYSARLIEHPDVRRVAELVREATPGAWVSCRELAAGLGCSPSTIAAAARRGDFKGYEMIMIMRAWYLWIPRGRDWPVMTRDGNRCVFPGGDRDSGA